MANNTPTAGNDTIIGTGGDDSLDLLNGNDVFYGLQGNDSVNGGQGSDALIGGSGIDIMVGGLDSDTYVIQDIGDVVTESSGTLAGTADAILTYVSYDMLLDDFDNGGLGNGIGDAINVENARIVSRHTWSDPLNGAFTGAFKVANNVTLAGNDLNNTLESDGGTGITMVGGLGNDTFVIHGLTGVTPASMVPIETLLENASEGTDTIMYTPLVAVLGQTLDLGTLPDIENMTFGGAIAINGLGNAADNVMTGNAGINTFTGLGGNDTYVIQSLLDKEIESNGTVGGIDTISCSITFSLAALPNIENITLTGSTNVNATGNAAVNLLRGNDGNNILDGVTSTGANGDTYYGSFGNDTYMVHRTIDTVWIDENTAHPADAGVDLIIANLANGDTYDMSANAIKVDNLTLAGTANVNVISNGENNVITGNAGVNEIFGGGGTDTLFGMGGVDTLHAGTGNCRLDGGTGADTMYNGNGNDTFIVDSSSDLILRGYTLPGTVGTDSILSSVSFNMLTQADDNSGETGLSLVGILAINAVGNNLGDTITGNPGINVIIGGTGDDSLIGGGGNDNMSGGAGSDKITGAGGNDTMDGGIGDDVLSGFGNRDILKGNDGNDVLDGGLYADTLIGGQGNDVYMNPDAQDILIEQFNAGIDTVQSSVSFSLAPIGNVENLFLNGGTIGIGNGLANVITGNAGVNTLQGGGLADTLFGSAGNDTLDGGSGADTMIGGVNNDTFIVDDVNDQVTGFGPMDHDIIFSSVDFDMTVTGTDVEALTLTGSTAIIGTGNALDNIITGNSAVNTLAGLTGGDTYVMNNIQDTIFEASSEGTDTVISTVNFNFSNALYGGQELENLTLSGANALIGIGNNLDNIITAVDANGATKPAWINTLTGMDGNDTYVVDPWDIINVDSGGNDTVVVAATYSIQTRLDLDNITLSGSGNFNATGNTNVNILTGNGGSNILDAGSSGGTGDTYVGSAGNDTYMVDELTDKIIEIIPIPGPDSGIDLVIASADNYDLSAQADLNIENLTLVGSALIGTGNGLGNIITGDLGANTLYGLGGNDTFYTGGLSGGGQDTMDGGTGSDTFFVDNATDIVVEAASGGVDTVLASVSYDMSVAALVGQEVEILKLTGTANINMTGNDVNNTITGNSGVNTLDGGLGNDTIDGGHNVSTVLGVPAGGDTMMGGAGNDTFIVNNANDTVIETSGNGTADLIKVGFTYTLADSAQPNNQVENLTLTGTAKINGTGNALDNTITGNSAVNILDGVAGADSYLGGGGYDTYMVDNTLDTVTSGTGMVRAIVDYDMGLHAAPAADLTLLGTAVVGTGNSLANNIFGNTSNVLINTLNGGLGNDTLYIYHAADQVLDNDSGSVQSDLIIINTNSIGGATGYDMLTNATQVRALVIQGSGNFDVIAGNVASAGLTPLPGGVTLTGNGGVNHFTGGTGDDTFYVAANDFVLGSGGGSDTVAIAFSLSLLADEALGGAAHWQGVEDIMLLGGTLALNAVGDTMVNTIYGNGGINIIKDGEDINNPSAGDTLLGGGGNDTYYVNNTGDLIDEQHNNGSGTDIVYSSVTFSIGPAVSTNVESLTLTGTANINAYGGISTNTLTGNSGNNILDGSLGADTMSGGAGNDTFFVDSSDTVIDTGGVDWIYSQKASLTLPTGIENLLLTETPSNIVKVGIGNTGANIITGNKLSDTLDGLTGADTMTGADGNDTYYVDSAKDIVIEFADTAHSTLFGDGSQDLIITKLSCTLDVNTVGAGSTVVPLTLPHFDDNHFVENLTLLTGGVWGVGNVLDNTITGNAGANTLVGGAGNDVLDGGLGKDVYVGGSGSDSFVIGVDAAKNHDTIVDATGSDVIVYNSLLIGYDPLKNVLDDFVAYRYDGVNSHAYVDADGVLGTKYGFVEVAILLNYDAT